MSFQHIPGELMQLFLIILLALLIFWVSLYAIGKALKETEKEIKDETKKQ